MKIWRKPNLFKISRELYVTTYVFFIVSGEIKSPQKRSLWLEWYRAVRKAKEIHASRERATMLRYTYSAFIVSLLKHV